MSTPTEFDEAFDDALATFLVSIGQKNLIPHLLDSDDNAGEVLRQANKQAVDKYVIGEDEYYGTGTPHRTENKLKVRQRQSLWGDK